jgi:hypothetical protein
MCYNQDTIPPHWWTLDGHGYLLTPSGAKCARVADGALWLYDRREKVEYQITLKDFYQLTATQPPA